MARRLPSAWPIVFVVMQAAALSIAGCTQFEPAPAALDTAASGGEDVLPEPAADGADGLGANEPRDSLVEGADIITPPEDAPGPDIGLGDAGGPPLTEDAHPLPQDVLADTVPAGDAMDGGEATDSGPDQGDGEDGDAVQQPPCVDVCPAEGVFRCMAGIIAARERCTTHPSTGCLFWDPYEVCQDNLCKGGAVCDNGACDHEGPPPLTCTSTDPCVASACDVDSEACVPTPVPGGQCDDGEACTSLDTCTGDGACAGTPDASKCPCSVDSDCLDEDPDGEACEDRYLCQPISEGNPALACRYSAAPTVCTAEVSDCTTSDCLPETGDCATSVAEEGTVCEDSDPCTTNEKCDDSGGCSGLPDAVNCACEVHAECLTFDDDGDACNGRYQCTDLGWASGAMACMYQAEPVTCPEPGSECLTAGCASATGECVDLAVQDGQACDDGDLCSASSSCLFGLCQATDLVSCPPAGPCDNVACDPGTGDCFVESITDTCCGNGVLEAGEACDTPASWCTKGCTETSCVPGSVALGFGCLQFATGEGVLGSTFTVDFFIRLAGADGTIIASGAGVNAPWRLGVEQRQAGPTLVWHETLMSGVGEGTIDGPSLVLGQWHHVTLTRDATAYPQVHVSFWRDAMASGDGAFLPSPLAHSDWGWLGCQGGTAQMLPALVDEFRWREGLHTPTEVPTGPVGTASALLLYHFDDVTPGVAVDGSGWGRHGAWQGCLRTDETPLQGQDGDCGASWCSRSALLFDPAQEGVGVIPPNAAMAGLSSLTVEFYLRLDDTSTTQMVISQSDDEIGGPDWHIQAIDGGGNLARLQWHEGQDTGVLIPLDNTVTSPLLLGDVTYHVAFVRSVGEGGDVTGRWYVDGEPGGPSTLQSPKGLELTDRPIYLGSQAGVSHFLAGFLDELRISKAAMYGEEAFAPSVIPETPETLGLYRFDIGTGSWAYSELWGTLPPMMLEGVAFATAGATDAGPCP